MLSAKKLTLRQVFIRVYRLEIQSVMLVMYFRPSFVNSCPSNLSSGSPLPPPFPVSILYAVYKYTVCKGGGIGLWASDR
jgi:hypothetical protein